MWEENIPSVPDSWPGNHLRLEQAWLPWAEWPLGCELELCLTWILATGTRKNTTKKAFKHKDKSLTHFPKSSLATSSFVQAFLPIPGPDRLYLPDAMTRMKALGHFPRSLHHLAKHPWETALWPEDGNWEPLDQGLSLAEGFTLTHCFPRPSIFSCLSQWIWQPFCSQLCSLTGLKSASPLF